MKQSALLLISVALGWTALPAFGQQNAGEPQHLPEIALHVDKATLEAQVAATPLEQELGLMFVTKLGDDEGMLFLLPKIERATFWMKSTLIPLSIAYISRDGVILDIHDMQPGDPTVPDQNLPITPSDTDRTAYALEANLHWFALNGIKPGDKITPPPTTWAKPQP